MSVRKGLVLLLAVSTFSFLAACGGGGTITRPIAPPSGSFGNSNLNGTYVFSISGLDASGSPFVALGTFTANGSGTISGGTIDMNDLAFSTALPNIQISNSSYNVGVDGRGTATLVLPTASSPFGTNIILDFVLQDGSHGLVMELDGSGVSGSGTLDLQTAGATPTGSYAYSFAGAAFSGGAPIATAGNFTVGTGNGLTGLEDFNQGGVVSYPGVATTGFLTLGPSSTPATTISGQFGTQTYDVYAIDSTHLKFIEMDSFALMSGDAYSQTSTTISAGTMAFTLSGIFPANTAFAAGGFMVTDGSGNITTASTEDYNEGGSLSAAAGTFSGTYSAGGTGRYTLGSFTGFVGGATYAAYPSSGGLLLLEIDNAAGITLGAAYQQTAGTTFAASQGYGLNLTGTNLGATGAAVEVDNIAEFTANSNATITGLLDENSAPATAGPTPGLSFATNTSSYGSIDSTGRFGLSSAIGNSSASTLNGGFNLIFYGVDGTSFPFIESDQGQVATGVIFQQNASAVTPVLAKAHNMFVPQPLILPHARRAPNK